MAMSEGKYQEYYGNGGDMAAEDWIDHWNDLTDDEALRQYEGETRRAPWERVHAALQREAAPAPAPTRGAIRPLGETQTSKTKWSTIDKYSGESIEITPRQMRDTHLMFCIHLCERRHVLDYEPLPPVYDKLLAEAQRRKLFTRGE